MNNGSIGHCVVAGAGGMLCLFSAQARIVLEPAGGGQVGGGVFAAAAAVPAAAAPAPVAALADVLRLANGDVLHGTLVSVNGTGAEGRLVWKHAAAVGTVEFSSTAADRIELAPRPAAGMREQVGSVQLANGDLLPGEVVSVDGANLLLDSWYAGRLFLPRQTLLGAVLAVPKANVKIVYDSQTDGLKGWLQPDGQALSKEWHCDKGVISTTQYGSLLIDGTAFPERVRFEFDIDRNAASSGMEVSLFCAPGKKTDEKPWPRMQFYDNLHNVMFMKPSGRGGGWSGDSEETPKEMRETGSNACHIAVLTDKTEGLAVILMNGRMLKTWSLAESVRHGGKGFMFRNISPSLKLANVRVSAWNGMMRQGEEEPVRLTRDAVVLGDGDRMQGKLLAVTDKAVRLETAYGRLPLEIPREQVMRLGFAGAAAASAVPPARGPGEILVRLAGKGGGCVTLAPTSLTDGVLKGIGAGIGGVSLPLAGISGLEWLPAGAKKGRKPFSDGLVLTGGDKLHGELISLAGGRLVWKPAGALAGVEFRLDGVDAVRLRPVLSDTVSGRRDYVSLTNGDQLAGRLLSLDTQALVLETDYAGKLVIPRAMLRRVVVGREGSDALYAGPVGLAGWGVASPPNQDKVEPAAYWKYENGTLVTIQDGATLGREVPGLPDAACFDFDVAWTNSADLQFSFFADQVVPADFGYTGYNLGIPLASTNISMNFLEKNGSSGTGQGAQYVLPDEVRKTHVTVKANRKTGRIILLFDGNTVGEFKEFCRNRCKGSCFAFRNLPEGMEISAIRVTPWENAKPAPGGAAATGGEVQPGQDSVLFANGDRLMGHAALAAGTGKVKLETEMVAPMEVPLERIAEIAQAASAAPAPVAGAVRVWLTGDAGWMTLAAAAELQDGRLKGMSAGFGAVEIPLARLARLEVVRPEKPPAEKKKSGGGGRGHRIMIH